MKPLMQSGRVRRARCGLVAGLVAGLVTLLFLASGPVRAESTAPPGSQILVMLRLPALHYRPDASYGGAYDDRAGRVARQRVAAALASDYGLTLVDGWPMPSLGVDCYLMAARSAAEADASLERLTRDPRAEWAQPVHQYAGLNHSDPLYSVQPSASAWHLDELHRVTTGHGVRVAVIDSAVEMSHPDLLGQVVLARNFVDARDAVGEAHGTEVAGIIAARADNQLGIVGVAPGARLLALRACWEADRQHTVCNSFTLAKALQFAIDADAQIINMSLTGPNDLLLGKLLDAALARGVLVVGAVDETRADGGFPAQHGGVIAVAQSEAAATGHATVVAPGQDVPTTAPGGCWAFVSGTSFAAAHISGLAALLLQVDPHRNPRAPIAWETYASAAPDHAAGAIDACATITHATRNCTCSCPTASATLLTQ
jgi:subtilisin family serine protease